MVADARTGRAREVWRSGKGQNDSMPPAGENLLQWAAGDRLVFASEQDGWMHLYTVPSDGGAPELLTRGACEVEHITYTPDRDALRRAAHGRPRAHARRAGAAARLPLRKTGRAAAGRLQGGGRRGDSRPALPAAGRRRRGENARDHFYARRAGKADAPGVALPLLLPK